MTETQVINDIVTKVYQNNINAITGTILQGVLTNMFQNIEQRELTTLSGSSGAIVAGDTIYTAISKLKNNLAATGLSNVLAASNTTGNNPIIQTGTSVLRNSDSSVVLSLANSGILDLYNTDGLYKYNIESDASGQYIQMKTADVATQLEMSYFQSFPLQVQLGTYSGSIGRLVQLEISNSEIKTNIVNHGTFEGIKYNADFSANYTIRSLVDKGYVDGLVSTGYVPYTGATASVNMGANSISFAGGYGIDVNATGGSDILNIGTANADVINIGYSGSTVNIQGTLAYQNVTNYQVKDKLITLNKGGAAASAVSTGFEIEENSVITGWFATDATRAGWDFKAPAATYYATLLLSSLTANRTYTLPDASGTLALTSFVTGGYVPYTGATASLNLGTYSLTAATATINNSAGNSSISIIKGSVTGFIQTDASAFQLGTGSNHHTEWYANNVLSARFLSTGQFSFGNYASPAAQRLVTIGQDTAWLTVGSQSGATSQIAFYANKASILTTNHFIATDGNNTYLNTQDGSNIYFQSGANTIGYAGWSSWLFGGRIQSTGAATHFTFTVPANTGQTASTEISNFRVNGSSKTWLAGAITNQRWNYFTANTAAFASASSIAESFGMYVEAATAGTNATIVNNFALGLAAGTATLKFGHVTGDPASAAIYLNQSTPTNTNYSIYASNVTTALNGAATAVSLWVGGLARLEAYGLRTSGSNSNFIFSTSNNTGQTASTEVPGYLYNSYSRQWNTGAISIQREKYYKTVTWSAVGASVINEGFGAYFEGPTAGTNITINNSWAVGADGGLKVMKSAGDVLLVRNASNDLFKVVASNGQSQFYGGGFLTNPSISFTGATNYGLSYQAQQLGLITNGNATVTVGQSLVIFSPTLASSGAITTYTFTKPNNTGQTTDVAIPGFLFTTGSRTWSGSANITNQKEVEITSPTYAAATSSSMSNAWTLYLTGPVAGTNVTFARAMALGIDGNFSITNNKIFYGVDSAGTYRAIMTWSAGDNIQFTGRPGVSDIILNPTSGGTGLYVKSNGDVGIGNAGPSARLVLQKTTQQLRLEYDASNYVSFTVGSTGAMTIASSTTSAAVSINNTLAINNAGFDNKMQFVRTGGDTYSIQHDAASLYLYNNTASKYLFRLYNAGYVIFDTPVASSGNNPQYQFTSATSSGHTAGANIPNIRLVSGTKTWAAGALSAQYFVHLASQTIAFASASTATAVYGLYVEAATVGTNATVNGNYALGLNGSMSLVTAGDGIFIKEGSNATLGAETIVYTGGGAYQDQTVNTTKVTANSRIILTVQSTSDTASTNVPLPFVLSRVAGTSFTIRFTSDVNATYVIAWLIIEPS